MRAPLTIPSEARHMRSETVVAMMAAWTVFRNPSEVSLVTTARS